MWPSALHRELAGETLVLVEGRWPFLFFPLERDSTCRSVRDGLGRRSVTQGAHNDTADDRRRSSSGTHEEQRWRTTTNGGTTATTSVGSDRAETVTALRVATGHLVVRARAAAAGAGRPGRASSSAERAIGAIVLLVMVTDRLEPTVRPATVLRDAASATEDSVPIARHGAGTAMTLVDRRARAALDQTVRPVRIVRVVMGIVRSTRIVRVVMGIVRSTRIGRVVMGIVRSTRIVRVVMGIGRSTRIVRVVMGIVRVVTATVRSAAS